MPGAPTRTFFGHPRALSSLFFAEMWERFSYYGMRALLVLFLVGAVGNRGLGLTDQDAAAIYGLYTAGVYIASLPGGWIADRLLGGQRAVFWGGLCITAGHLLLALAPGLHLFCIGLAVIVLGTGLLKPNIASLVATLYPEGGARRDAGFTLFYMGINLGAVLGPLVTGYLAQRYGWHVGFLAAAAGMALGLAWFWGTRGQLGEAGRRPAPHPQGEAGLRRDRVLLIALGAGLLMLAVLVATGVLAVSAQALRANAVYLIVALVVGFFAYLLLLAGINAAEKRRVVVLAALFLASAVFWSGFEQAGSSMTLFAERYTDRLAGSFVIPTSWFQSLNAAFIIVFAPVFSAIWMALGRRDRDLSLGVKFILGLAGMALGFVVMAAASRIVAGGAQAGPGWLLLAYLLHTWGELALSPVGMSATTRLVPQRFAGQSMGLWYASLSLGNLVASQIAGEFDASHLAAMPGQYLRIFWFGAIAALALLVATPVMKRWSATGS